MHDAISDYRPDGLRLMRRCQVEADWIFTDVALPAVMVGARGSRAAIV